MRPTVGAEVITNIVPGVPHPTYTVMGPGPEKKKTPFLVNKGPCVTVPKP